MVFAETPVLAGERQNALDADLMNVVVDRFAHDVNAAPSNDGKAATVIAPVCESPVF